MTTNAVAIVIPALNEAEALSHLLADLPADLARWIIVVDNNSTDATASVARAAGALVVSEPLRGYGRACWRVSAPWEPGAQAASQCYADAYNEQLLGTKSWRVLFSSVDRECEGRGASFSRERGWDWPQCNEKGSQKPRA